jgi:hypothetical protein
MHLSSEQICDLIRTKHFKAQSFFLQMKPTSSMFTFLVCKIKRKQCQFKQQSLWMALQEDLCKNGMTICYGNLSYILYVTVMWGTARKKVMVWVEDEQVAILWRGGGSSKKEWRMWVKMLEVTWSWDYCVTQTTNVQSGNLDLN